MIGMIWWALGGPRKTKRKQYTWQHPHPKSIAAKIQRRKAEKRYIQAAVRRMELNEEARKVYAQRHPAPQLPHVIPGAAPESRYSNPEFWSDRR